ncbi:MAG TPA: oxidoreductase [Thermodesulfobacteriota bacterium]|nr:oxidoreductase [Thermodesulfobacteriota bacterium]
MGNKPKVAIYWLMGCGGCDETIVDLNEALLAVADAVDIVLWPIAMDFKYDSLRSLKEGEIALTILNGAVRNSEHEEMAKLLREKSQLVLGFGACACFGGTPGLANFRSRRDIFEWVYRDAPTVVNPKGNMPQVETAIDGFKLTLPEFYEKVYPLRDIIPVDYFLPGCPPPASLVGAAVTAVLEGKLPQRGATLAPSKPLCDACARNKTKPARLEIAEFRRVHQVEADEATCFLAQGIVCLGPAVRSGCGETCMRINLPCRGCFGPVEGVADAGVAFLSGLASIIGAEKEEDVRKTIGSLTDLTGTCYRFSLPSASLKPKGKEE